MANKLMTFVNKVLDFGGVPTEKGGDRLSFRNYIMFPLGTLGRDFLYQLFNGYLMTFILFTKHLDPSMFVAITAIIIVARIFDAFNDPIMGGIVENTRSKMGKYKPWQLTGAVLTGGVIIAVFCVDLDGWAFIGLLGVAYLLFSVTFTMNDISYWGMMPSLTSHPGDRNKLTSLAQILAGAGSGLAGTFVGWFTAGWLVELIGKISPGYGAIEGYRALAIIAAVLMIGFQLFTILGVKEKPLPAIIKKTDRLSLKQMFKTILKNDQLLWTTLVLLLASLGNSIMTGSILTYFYFEFCYDGSFFTIFCIGMSVTSTLFTLFYPWLAKKFGRKKSFFVTVACQVLGFVFMLVFGLALPTAGYMETGWWAKFVLMAIGYGIAGLGQGFYMILVISIANTVEYNEWKTGKREESLIFSLRPFTAKLSSALQQGVIAGIYLIAGVTAFTNLISDAEKAAQQQLISNEELTLTIRNIIAEIPNENKMILLSCICIIPIVFMIVAAIIFKKKCILDEPTLERMMAEVAERNQQASIMDGDVCETIVFDGDNDTIVCDENATDDSDSACDEPCQEPPQELALEDVASDLE